MLCRDCKHLKTKKVGYVSYVEICRVNNMGVISEFPVPHKKCPLKNNKPKIKKEANTMAKLEGTKVITGLVRFSYVNIFNSRKFDANQDEKFSICIIIDKKDKETLKVIKGAIEAAKEVGKSKSWGGKVPGNLKSPLRDGSEREDEAEEYEGMMFLNASSKTKPGIVDKNRNEVLDTTEVYSGCYGRVSLNFYPFNSNGNKGIAAGLNNVQMLKDGEPLGASRASAESDFGDDSDDDLLD